jgi:hypothetical protein
MRKSAKRGGNNDRTIERTKGIVELFPFSAGKLYKILSIELSSP